MTEMTSCRLDALIRDELIFSLRKHDIATTTGIMKGSALGLPYDLWIKRFNNKGLLDFVLKKIVKSRAKRAWETGYKLYEKGLPVPRPFAFIESSLKERASFFISSVIEHAENLGTLYVRGQFNESAAFARQLGQVIAAWHLAGAVHGDLKWSNILLQEDGERRSFFFVDLDQAKLYAQPHFKGMVKDLVRFYRYGLELGAEEWIDSQFFPAYMAELPDAVRAKIDLPSVRSKAVTIWRRKGSRQLPAPR